LSPENPQTPSEGTPEDVKGAHSDEAKIAKEAAATEKSKAKADPTGKAEGSDEAKAEKKTPAKPKAASKKKEPAAKAKDAAAEETGVDKAAAKAGAEAEDKPKKPGRKKAASDTEAAAKDRPKPAAKRRAAGGSDNLITVKAQARYVRTSARKARLVCEHIRGKDVQEARAILAFTPRSVAKDWAKVLESAVANAEHNHELVGEDLKVTKVYADEGPTLKRFRPRAMGRATRIRKRTAHLTIELTPKGQ
jgi:ribosomal protein L22